MQKKTENWKQYSIYCSFNLQQHIKFHTEVLKCEAHEDWESTGRWWVRNKKYT